MLFRQRWAMLAAFVLVVIGVAISGVWVPKYDAKMKILVQRERSDTKITSSATWTRPIQQRPGKRGGSQFREVELLNSEDLLRKVVLKTGLGGNSSLATDRDSEIGITQGRYAN